MPRLYHRSPKYSLHKRNRQATVSLHGKRVYLGPYGSPESHVKYQEILKAWQAERDKVQPLEAWGGLLNFSKSLLELRLRSI